MTSAVEAVEMLGRDEAQEAAIIQNTVKRQMKSLVLVLTRERAVKLLSMEENLFL